MTAVKICGITRWEDARVAADEGAQAIGFVFAPSPRRVTPERARAIAAKLPPFLVRVGVFVDAPVAEMAEVARAVGLDAVQLHGGETPAQVAALRSRCPCRIIKAIRVRSPDDLAQADTFGADAILVDSYQPGRAGGTGAPFPWEWLKAYPAGAPPLILAGGLRADNVYEALRTARPYGVDVSSGVERAPGVKDRNLIARFIREVRRYDRAAADGG